MNVSPRATGNGNMREGIMANAHRKMASIQEVKEIRPIEGADRIEVATILGWQVVVGKGEFSAGDEVVYFEVDTFLPEGDPRFAFLMPRGVREMEHAGHAVRGHVLRTAKLRGTYSQGLAMSPGQLGLEMAGRSVGDDVTEEVGVWEYEPIIVDPDAIGAYDTSIAPVTGAMRIQSCPEVWDDMRRVACRASVKVDGVSMTIMCDGRDGRLRVFGHNYELSPASGRGKKAIDACRDLGIVGFCEQHPGYVVQFEFAGPKVHGNHLALPAHRPFVFAVWRGVREKVPFEDEAACPGEGYDALRAAMCPTLDVSLSQFDGVDDVIEWASGLRGNVSGNHLDEGVVFHVMGPGDVPADEWPRVRMRLLDALGEPLELKVISNRYLVKHKV